MKFKSFIDSDIEDFRKLNIGIVKKSQDELVRKIEEKFNLENPTVGLINDINRLIGKKAIGFTKRSGNIEKELSRLTRKRIETVKLKLMESNSFLAGMKRQVEESLEEMSITSKVDIYDKGKSSDHWFVYFRTSSGLKYLVNAQKLRQHGRLNYDFTFMTVPEDETNVGKYLLKGVELADKKEIWSVFAGVAKAFDMFVKEVKPDSISFSANEPRKKSLYKKFAEHIVKKYPYKIEKGTEWVLVKEGGK